MVAGEQVRYCSACGAEIDGGARFCWQCGGAVEPKRDQTEQRPAESSEATVVREPQVVPRATSEAQARGHGPDASATGPSPVATAVVCAALCGLAAMAGLMTWMVNPGTVTNEALVRWLAVVPGTLRPVGELRAEWIVLLILCVVSVVVTLADPRVGMVIGGVVAFGAIILVGVWAIQANASLGSDFVSASFNPRLFAGVYLFLALAVVAVVGAIAGRSQLPVFAATTGLGLVLVCGLGLVVLASGPEEEMLAFGVVRDQSPKSVASSSASPTRSTTTTRLVPPTSPSTTAPVVRQPSTTRPTAGGVVLEEWVAMLASMDATESAARAEYSSIAADVPGARFLRSDSVPSLRPGYWIAYVPGFSTPESALAFCRSVGRLTRDECYAAYFSSDPADVARRMYP